MGSASFLVLHNILVGFQSKEVRKGFKACRLLQEKNVESDMLEGKLGRIYMPRQAIEAMPQHKMKVRFFLKFFLKF